jgi:hypothetical protein
MIAVVTLGKNLFKIIFFHAFIIIFNVRLKYGFRKIIILMNNNFEENFISQRFVKKNGLINDLIRYIGKFIDRYAIIIYGKHNLVIYIKNSEN